MRRVRTDLKSPETMTFKLSLVAANRFRNYCWRKKLVMGAILEQAVIDFLIAEGDIESEESLRIEEAMTK